MQPQLQHLDSHVAPEEPHARPGAGYDAAPVPGLGLGDLRFDLIERARKLACSRDSGHAWWGLTAEGILHVSGLSVPDPASDLEVGEFQLTRAALLLFGKDEAIQRLLPGRCIETRAQVLDYQGYDDQATIQSNLMDSYDMLMAFVRRNLPEGKRLPELPTVCTRDALFAGIVSNLLLHRDYESQAWSRLTIQKDRISVENPCISGRRGLLDLACIQVSPKNPLLYRFFETIHLTGGPGSGMKALARWSRDYFGTDVLVFDRENFKIFATSPAFPAYVSDKYGTMQAELVGQQSEPVLPGNANMQGRGLSAINMQDLNSEVEKPLKPAQNVPVSALDEHASSRRQDWDLNRTLDSTKINPTPLSESPARGEPAASRSALHEDRIGKILRFCETPRNREEIQAHIGLNNRDYFRKEILVPLLQEGRLVATIPDKPNSPKQQYRTPTPR